MKKISIILVISLIALICLSACGKTEASKAAEKAEETQAVETKPAATKPAATEKVTESEQPVNSAAPYTVETVGEKDVNSNGEVIGDCHYQKVVFSSTDAAFKEINEETAEACNEFFEEGLGKQYEEYFTELPDSVKEGLSAQPFSAKYDVKDVYIDDNYISIIYEWDWFVGGVRNYGSDALNFDVKTGEKLDFEDMFASESDARKAFTKAVNSFIDSDPGAFFSDAKDTVSSYDLDDVKFGISKSNISVYIDQYEIGPSASGSFIIDIAR